jgi:hypothetical protein
MLLPILALALISGLLTFFAERAGCNRALACLLGAAAALLIAIAAIALVGMQPRGSAPVEWFVEVGVPGAIFGPMVALIVRRRIKVA